MRQYIIWRVSPRMNVKLYFNLRVTAIFNPQLEYLIKKKGAVSALPLTSKKLFYYRKKKRMPSTTEQWTKQSNRILPLS